MRAERIVWIDNIKAIAIFFVVMGHCIDTVVIKSYIYTFHMHLFFFVAGVVFSERYGFAKFCIKRIKTLLVPYFIFSIINYLFYLLRRVYGETPDLTTSPVQEFVNIFTWNQYWFLGTLFIVSIVFRVISKKIRTVRDVLLLAVVCTFLHFLLSVYFSAYVHENLLKCFTAMVFYCLGVFVGRSFKHYSPNHLINSMPYVLLIVVFVNLLVFCFFYRAYGFMNINFCENYFYFYFLSISGIFIFYIVSHFIKENVFMDFVGANTIIIYLMHNYPPGIIRRLMIYFWQIDNFSSINFTFSVAYSVMNVLILVPIILFINRFCPFIVGKPFRTEIGKLKMVEKSVGEK